MRGPCIPGAIVDTSDEKAEQALQERRGELCALVSRLITAQEEERKEGGALR
jgi:hypothetical protein